MLCKLEGDKYSCSYLRKGQGRITDITRLGLQAAQFMGQSPTLLVFYRQLICIMQKERVTPRAPAFTSHIPPLPPCFLFIFPVSGHSIIQAMLLWTSNALHRDSFIP